MADSKFWTDRQAEFLTYGTRFAPLSAQWKAYHGQWILLWDSTPVAHSDKFPDDCLSKLNETAGKALQGLPNADSGGYVAVAMWACGANNVWPWQLWLTFMWEHKWHGFKRGAWHRVSQRVWDAGVKVGRPPAVVRRELLLSTGDELEADRYDEKHDWPRDLALDEVFKQSAEFCELAQLWDMATQPQESNSGSAKLNLADRDEKVEGSEEWKNYGAALSEVADAEAAQDQEAVDPAGGSTDTGTAQRAIIDAFIAKLMQAGYKITRKDIWTVAGYRDRTEFERFQRGDSRTTRSASESFNRVLRMTPEKFVESLKKKTTR